MSKLSKKRQNQKKGAHSGSKLPWKKRSKLPQKEPTSQLTESQISAYKREMQSVINDANFLIDAAIDRGEVSVELDRFLKGDSSKRFDITKINDAGELRAYMTEVEVIASTIQPLSRKGAIDSALAEAEIYRGQFGNQHRNAYTDDSGTHYYHYNTAPIFDDEGNLIRRAIDPHLAQRVFSAYRRLEEQYAGYIGRQGQELMFGSENLIILLYDFYEKNRYADYDFDKSGTTDDALLEFSPLLRDWINAQLAEMESINTDFSRAKSIIADWNEFFDRRYF